MNSKTALCQALINGEVINIRNIHNRTGYTNSGREISRQIEKPFGVIVSRTRKEGKNRWKVYCTWTNYRLNQTPYNRDGIRAMKKYIKEQTAKK